MTEIAIDNGLVRVTFAGPRGAASVQAHDAGGWRAVLARAPFGPGTDALGAAVEPARTGVVTSGAVTTLAIHRRYERGEHHAVFLLRAGSPWIEATESIAIDDHGRAAAIDAMEATWRFVDWREPGEVSSPHLVPEVGDVIGRHALRAPALTAQCGGVAAALVADVDSMRKQQALPACMDFVRDEGAPVMTTGLRPHAVRGHVFYQKRDEPAHQPVFHHAYHLCALAGAADGAALDVAGSFLWARFGHRGFVAAPELPLTHADYARRVYDQTIPARWRETVIDGRRVGAITLDGSYAGDSWLSAWWNALNSAYGLHRWGAWLGRRDWVERALCVRELALAAPRDRGLFPTVFVFGDTPAACRWIGSHQQGGGLGILHLLDMSWTTYLLLIFHRDCAADARTIATAKAYCAALRTLQREDGGLPAWIDERTHAPIERVDQQAQLEDLLAHPTGDHHAFRTHGLRHGWSPERFTRSAEDSASLLMAAELALALPTGDPERAGVLAFARGVAGWLERHVIPEARWLDFEVSLSCAPKSHLFRDERSGQWAQNTLCMNHAALGLLRLHAATGDAHYRELGGRVLARLQLYQQVWDPPFLQLDAFGGYAVQNTDGEWNDARQALFAQTHAEWHRATGSVEQRERALSACRAGFVTIFDPAAGALSPTGWFRQPSGSAAENHGHAGVDGTCCVSGWDWGSGSALTAAAYLRHVGVIDVPSSTAMAAPHA